MVIGVFKIWMSKISDWKLIFGFRVVFNDFFCWNPLDIVLVLFPFVPSNPFIGIGLLNFGYSIGLLFFLRILIWIVVEVMSFDLAHISSWNLNLNEVKQPLNTLALFELIFVLSNDLQIILMFLFFPRTSLESDFLNIPFLHINNLKNNGFFLSVLGFWGLLRNMLNFFLYLAICFYFFLYVEFR